MDIARVVPVNAQYGSSNISCVIYGAYSVYEHIATMEISSTANIPDTHYDLLNTAQYRFGCTAWRHHYASRL